MTERDFENILERYPDLIEDGLTLEGRQIAIGRRHIDLVFKDKFGQRLIIELKKGTILRKHIAQLFEYEGDLLTPEDPNVRVMLIGNRVPPNLRRSLEHHGFEWLELTIEYLAAYIRKKGDNQFDNLFEDEIRSSAKATNHEIKSPSELDLIDISEFPLLVEQIIEKVLRPISNNISSSIGKRYTSYFLKGGRFLHFYDRSQNRIQLHIDKKYLYNNNRHFDISYLGTKFPVNETQDDFVIKIRSGENLDFLADFLFKLYNKQ